RLRPFSEGAFLVDVFNAAHQRIGGHLAFVKATQWLDLARQPVRGGQDGSLAQEIFTRPGQCVSEEHSSLVVEVVARRQYVIAQVPRHAVHLVTLCQPTDGTWLAMPAVRDLREDRNGLPV